MRHSNERWGYGFNTSEETKKEPGMSVTMNGYTHIGFDDAEEELRQMEEFRRVQDGVEKRTMQGRYRRKCSR